MAKIQNKTKNKMYKGCDGSFQMPSGPQCEVGFKQLSLLSQKATQLILAAPELWAPDAKKCHLHQGRTTLCWLLSRIMMELNVTVPGSRV